MVKPDVTVGVIDFAIEPQVVRSPAAEIQVCSLFAPPRRWARVRALESSDTCDVLLVHDEHWTGPLFSDVDLLR